MLLCCYVLVYPRLVCVIMFVILHVKFFVLFLCVFMS